MEKHKIRISSDTDNVSLEAFPDGIIINGQTISFNDVIALTNGSHTVRTSLGDAQQHWLSIETLTKSVKIEVSYSDRIFSKPKDRGLGLYEFVSGEINRLIMPRLVFNYLRGLAKGETIRLGQFSLNAEGLLRKTLLSEKFCSWEWNLRYEPKFRRKGFFSPTQGSYSVYEITYTSPSTHFGEIFGEITFNDRNAALLMMLCLVLGMPDNALQYTHIPACLSVIEQNIQLFVNMPPSAMRRQLARRFPSL